jgi:hypothetical protein
MGDVYAAYIVCIVAGSLLPIFIMKLAMNEATRPATLAFSNTPGALRPIKSKDSECLSMINSFNSASKCSITIGFISYAGGIHSSVSADTGVMKNPKVLLEGLESAIEDLLKLASK